METVLETFLYWKNMLFMNINVTLISIGLATYRNDHNWVFCTLQLQWIEILFLGKPFKWFHLLKCKAYILTRSYTSTYTPLTHTHSSNYHKTLHLILFYFEQTIFHFFPATWNMTMSWKIPALLPLDKSQAYAFAYEQRAINNS